MTAMLEDNMCPPAHFAKSGPVVPILHNTVLMTSCEINQQFLFCNFLMYRLAKVFLATREKIRYITEN